MKPKCRHVMSGGGQCHGYAIRGQDLCYFHSGRRVAAQKPVSSMDSIEIPLFEDRCAVQVTLTQVLRHVVNKTIDRPSATLILYGLQLALQTVDRSSWAIPIDTVQAITRTSDGEDLVLRPADEEDDEDEDEDEDEDADSDDEDDEMDDEEGGDGIDNESTEELVAGARHLVSVRQALEAGDMRQVARLLKE